MESYFPISPPVDPIKLLTCHPCKDEFIKKKSHDVRVIMKVYNFQKKTNDFTKKEELHNSQS